MNIEAYRMSHEVHSLSHTMVFHVLGEDSEKHFIPRKQETDCCWTAKFSKTLCGMEVIISRHRENEREAWTRAEKLGIASIKLRLNWKQHVLTPET